MPATALRIKTLTAGFTVNDLQKSLKFYRDGLGFTVGHEYKDDKGVVKGCMLEAGGGSGIAISQDDFAKGRDRVKGVGVRLYIDTDQDIAALAATAKSAGIKLDEGPGPLPWGPTGFTVTDLDGYKLTIANPE
jgi:catechol 2,3-dioxygenase-like lactoylglutathione lyase family enzyme